MKNTFTNVFLNITSPPLGNRSLSLQFITKALVLFIVILLSVFTSLKVYSGGKGNDIRLLNFGSGPPLPHVLEYGSTRTYFMPDLMNNAIIREPLSDYSIYILPENNVIYFPGFPKILQYGNNFSVRYSSLICNMDSDDDLEIVVSVCNGNFSSSMVYVWNYDSTLVPGWPQPVPYNASISPAFGDIDGDGQKELVVISYAYVEYIHGSLYAFRKNGTVVPGFPIPDFGYSPDSPVLADLNNDGALEIITSRNQDPGLLEIYRGNGTMFPGWPQSLPGSEASSSAVGDIDGDSSPEIIAETYNYICAFSANGTMLPGFPVSLKPDEHFSYSSPVLADLNNDGKREIIFGTHIVDPNNQYDTLGYVHILRNDGANYPNWPRAVRWWIYGAPSVGYIDDDNILDITVGDNVGSFGKDNCVYAWNIYGEQLAGFPIIDQDPINSQVTLGDIDNDNKPELIVDNAVTHYNVGSYAAYNNDGTLLPGWPLSVIGTTFYKTMCLADLDRNGTIDLIGNSGASSKNYVHVWDSQSSYDTNNIYLPVFQYNERHDGVFLNRRIIGIQNNQNEITKDYILYQNFPNPFNPNTTIQFDIPKKSFINLTVYDILGRKLDVLYNGEMQAGKHGIVWNAYKYSSGIYFYRLQSDTYSETKKMIVEK